MAPFYPVARGRETANRRSRVGGRLWHCNSVLSGYDPGAFFATAEPYMAFTAGFDRRAYWRPRMLISPAYAQAAGGGGFRAS